LGPIVVAYAGFISLELDPHMISVVVEILRKFVSFYFYHGNSPFYLDKRQAFNYNFDLRNCWRRVPYWKINSKDTL
jgi:hypothetical protein